MLLWELHYKHLSNFSPPPTSFEFLQTMPCICNFRYCLLLQDIHIFYCFLCNKNKIFFLILIFSLFQVNIFSSMSSDYRKQKFTTYLHFANVHYFIQFMYLYVYHVLLGIPLIILWQAIFHPLSAFLATFYFAVLINFNLMLSL